MLNDIQIKIIINLVKEKIGRLNSYKNNSFLVFFTIKHKQEIENSIDFYKKLLEDLGEK